MDRKYRLEEMGEAHRRDVIDLLNHYAQNTFAAYFENPVEYGFYDLMLSATRAYPAVVARDAENRFAGFGMLRAHNTIPAFRTTAEAGYFLHPDHVRRGLGRAILQHLIAAARDLGIDCIVASVCSKNTPSLRFHQAQGFAECGRFRRVGQKFGQRFDVVWMQRFI